MFAGRGGGGGAAPPAAPPPPPSAGVWSDLHHPCGQICALVGDIFPQMTLVVRLTSAPDLVLDWDGVEKFGAMNTHVKQQNNNILKA